jgi:Putative beta-barrel porin 2
MQKTWRSVALRVAADDYVDVLRLSCQCPRRMREYSAVHLGRLCRVFFWLIMALASTQTNIYAQTSTPAAEPVPVIAEPPPPPQEQRLAPVPETFSWMRREVRANPLLEGLLALQEQPSQLFLSVTLSEEYSDNFNAGNTDNIAAQEQEAREEYRTSLGIGTSYRIASGASFVALANTINAHYDALAGEGDVGFANLSLNAGHRTGPLSLALNESFLRDDDVGEASPAGTRLQRQTFLRNSISPQVHYTLSLLTAVDLAYANTVTFGGEADQDNAVTHTISTGLQHRFSRVVNGAVDYGFTTGTSQDAADTQAHAVSAKLGYLIDRLTSLSLQGFGRITDRSNGGTDSQTYGFTVGLRRQLTSLMGFFVSLGPTLLDREGQGQRLFFNWQANLDGALPFLRHASLALTTQQGVNDTTGAVDEVGIVLSRSVGLNLSYLVTRNLHTLLSGSYVHTEFLEDVGAPGSFQGRKDNFWRAEARVTYALTRTISLAAAYLYQRRDTNLPNADFDENRVTLTVSSNFVVF